MSKKTINEGTPLLDEEKGAAQEEEKKPEKTMGQKIWSHVHFTPGAYMADLLEYFDLAPGFGESIELAVRAGVVASIFGALLLGGNAVWTDPVWKARAATLDELITPFTLIMFYFALGKSLGETLYLIWGMLLGQGIATATTWFIFGVAPGGYLEGSPEAVWWFGILFGGFVVIATLWANMDGNIKIWVLANWIFFWTSFMDPAPNLNNQGFKFHQSSSRNLMYRQALFAAGCGLCVALLPYPIWAQEKLTKTAKSTADQLCRVWQDLARAYWSNPDASVYEFDTLANAVDSLKAANGKMSTYMAHSWWECFGFGHLNSTRFCCQTLIDTLDHDLDRLPPVLAAISESQAQSSPEDKAEHERVGKMYAPHVHRLNDATCDLMKKSTDVAIRGGPTESDKEELTKGIAEVKKAIDSLHDAVTTKRPNTGSSKKVLDLDFLDEYTFFFCISHFGRSTSTFAQHLLDVQYETPSLLGRIAFLFVPWDFFNMSVLLDSDHIRFVIRNSLAILLAFALGYGGFPPNFMKLMDDVEQVSPASMAAGHETFEAPEVKMMTHATMLPELSPGPAFILCLMVSKFAGSAIGNTLNRVMGTILGIIFAMMLIGVFGRNWKLLTVILGLWTTWTVFMYLDCTVHAGLFLMMGYFGAGSMVRCVPARECSFEDRKTRAIGLVIDGMFALAVMIVVDIIMAAKPPSIQASDMLLKCWDDIVGSTKQLFDENPDTRKNTGVIRDELNSCYGLGYEAANEPRYWKTPWQGTLYDHSIKRNLDLRLSMVCMHYSVAVNGVNGAPKADFFKKIAQDKEFKEIGDQLIARMGVMTKLFGIFAYEGQSRWEQLKDKSIRTNYVAEQQELLERFVAYVNKPEQAWLLDAKDDAGNTEEDSLEKDSLTKLSLMILLMQSMMFNMRYMQHSILRSD
jgi:hypothetical protein